jgi:HemY protein
MIRILIYFLVILALGFGFSWLAERPGDLFIIWQGQRIEMSLMVAATMLVVLVALVMFVWWLVRTIWTSPHSVTRYFRARKRDRGYQALSTGLIAVGSGDAPLARKMLDRTKGLIRADQEPLIHLLEAQASLIEGKTEDARKKFEAMAEDPETRELGLRGLYLEAQRLGAHEAARHYAEKAVEKAPHLPWAADATLEYRAQAGRFDDAIRLLEQQRVLAGMDRRLHDRKKAVLLAGRALARLESDPKGARDDATAALKLAPALVPAATIAAKAYLRENNSRKAMATLEQVWRLAPNSELAAAYLNAGGASAADKQRRAERLEAIQPTAYEALYASASAAYDARDFATARRKAEAAAKIDERESIYMLMADIEEAETGDQARVRHWLSQALRAQRDPEWVADGRVSPHWLPISPISGRLDAFEWKRAVAAAPLAIEGKDFNKAAEAFSRLPDAKTEPAPEPKAADNAVKVPESGVNAEVLNGRAAAAPVLAAEPVLDAAAVAVAAEASAKSEPQKLVPAQETTVDDKPFFGRAPDDPGVKAGKAPEKNGFRLF